MAASKVEAEIFRAARARGLSPRAAAGMIGNAAQESSLDPNVANGFGLYQTSGYGPSSGLSVAEQTDKAISEMGSAVVNAMNNAKTPAEAARIMEVEYEKPAGSQPGESATTNNRPHRESAAEVAYRNLTGESGGGTQGGSVFNEGGFGEGGIFKKAGEGFQEVEKGVEGAGEAASATGELAEVVLKWLNEPTRLLKLAGGAALLYMGVKALTSGTAAEPIANVPGKAVQAVAGAVPADRAIQLASKGRNARKASRAAKHLAMQREQKGNK